MPPLTLPSFPDRTWDIRDYGAVGDGRALSGQAFALAVADCSAGGGGHVLVPPGAWLSGPIHLLSNVNLHLEEGAEIRFSTDFGAYLPAVFTRHEGVECFNYSPLVYANGCANVAITGAGTLNGQGEAWWPWFARQGPAVERLLKMAHEGIPATERLFATEADALRPSFVQFINCKGVLLAGVTVRNGPMWTIHPVYCENVIIRQVTVITRGKNGDGIDVDSCRNVLVECCRFDVNDDAVVIKSGRDDDGLRINRPSENIVVRHCRSGLGTPCHGAVAIGSESSGGVNNVYVHDCHFDGTKRAVRLKSMRGRGGTVENVWLHDISAGTVRLEALQVTSWFEASPAPYTAELPLFRNIHIKNLTCRRARNALQIIGLPEQPVENVTVENALLVAEQGLLCQDAERVELINVQVLAERDPLVRLKDCRDISIRKAEFPADQVLVEIQGARSANIQIVATDRPGPAATS